MSDNILSIIMNNVSPQFLARCAQMLGIDRMITDKAMNAAIPAVLAGIARAVGKPEGVRQLGSAIANEPSNWLDNMANMAGGSAQQSMISSGTSLLSSLLGSNGLKLVTDALGRYAGVAPGQASSLAGLAGLLAVSGLGKAQRESGLDINGLAQRLTAQAPQFAAAMPAGFSDLLRGAEIPRTEATPTRPAEEVRRSQRVPAGGSATALPNWLYWALGALILLGIAWLLQPLLNRPQVAQAPPSTTTTTQVPGQSMIAVGTPIYSSDGERLGDVVEVVTGPNNIVESVRLEVGAPLGIGPKTVMINADQIDRKGDRVVSKLTAAEARALPPAPATK
jgi:hypothetical protein